MPNRVVTSRLCDLEVDNMSFLTPDQQTRTESRDSACENARANVTPIMLNIKKKKGKRREKGEETRK